MTSLTFDVCIKYFIMNTSSIVLQVFFRYKLHGNLSIDVLFDIRLH